MQRRLRRGNQVVDTGEPGRARRHRDRHACDEEAAREREAKAEADAKARMDRAEKEIAAAAAAASAGAGSPAEPGESSLDTTLL